MTGIFDGPMAEAEKLIAERQKRRAGKAAGGGPSSEDVRAIEATEALTDEITRLRAEIAMFRESLKRSPV